jgi:secreted Zn-dependent insulinase-like peptidase
MYDDYCLIVTKFYLTKKGYKHIDEIIQIFFEYISSIINNNNLGKLEKIYEDINNQNHKYYKYPTNGELADTMLDFNNLLNNKINPQNLLNYYTLRPKFNEMKSKLIDLLKDMRLYNSSVIIGSLKNKLDKILHDDIYNIKYSINKLEPIKIEKKYYELIDNNKYITPDIDLIREKDSTHPERIDKKYNLFYNFNSSFKSLDVNIYISIDIPALYESAETYTKTILFLDTIYSDNSNIINNIVQAGYNLTLNLEYDTLYIYISGDRNIIDILSDDLNKILNNTNGTCFETVREKMYKIFKNSINDQVIHKINKLIHKKIEKKYYDSYDIIKYIKDNTFEKCKDTFFNIIKNAATNIMISGNINKNDAENVADKLYSCFNIAHELEPNFDKNIRKRNLPYIDIYFNRNIKEKNTMFTMMYEVFSVKKNDKDYTDYSDYIAFLSLLNSISNTQYFNSLRTNDQLGYIVYTKINYYGNKNTKNGFLKFVIQSPFENAEKLYDKTMIFVKNILYKFIKDLGEDGLKTYIDGLITNLSNKFNNLLELDLYNCSNIFDYSYDFNFRENIINSLKKITHSNFVEKYKNLIINNNNIYSISIDPYKENSDKLY